MPQRLELFEHALAIASGVKIYKR